MAYTSNVPIAWTKYHREYVGYLTLLELPSYAFDLKGYWSPYQKDLISPVTSSQTGRAPAAVPEQKQLLTTRLQYVEKESFEGYRIPVGFHPTLRSQFYSIRSKVTSRCHRNLPC